MAPGARQTARSAPCCCRAQRHCSLRALHSMNALLLSQAAIFRIHILAIHTT